MLIEVGLRQRRRMCQPAHEGSWDGVVNDSDRQKHLYYIEKVSQSTEGVSQVSR